LARTQAPQDLFAAGMFIREARQAAEIAERLLGDLCVFAIFSYQFAGRP
jgi:hypothetical protein